jgi:hypothetical protein
MEWMDVYVAVLPPYVRVFLPAGAGGERPDEGFPDWPPPHERGDHCPKLDFRLGDFSRSEVAFDLAPNDNGNVHIQFGELGDIGESACHSFRVSEAHEAAWKEGLQLAFALVEGTLRNGTI